jgi:uncharacterized protein YjiS (DUF1127 family)
MLTNIDNPLEPTMPTHQLLVTIALWQPWHLQLWALGGTIARAPWYALRRIWRQHSQRLQRRADCEGLAALDPHTLRDIGASECAVQDAVLRREAARLRIDQVSIWRGV